jgi:DAK2 domain fusion protein YloV
MEMIDGQMLKRMLGGGMARIHARADELNALNVFPVPDGDTGSNMLKTMERGWRYISESESLSAGEIMSAFANGAVLGARGNSGVILSQIFRGIAKGVAEKDKLSATDLTEACTVGVQAAYGSVMKPVEGTILTVFRESAAIDDAADVEEWFTRHVQRAAESLKRTPELLPTLKEAGVVDSGGAGYLCLIEGMLQALTGEEIAVAYDEPSEREGAQAELDFSLFTRDSVLEFGYCTEFFLRLQSAKTDVEQFDDEALKAFLNSVGDSLVYVRLDDLIKVHVHTKTPGQVLNECQKYGEFLSMKMENMSLQHEETLTQKQAPSMPKKHVAVVAVAMSDGMQELFEENGADYVISGGALTNPSTEEFLEAFRSVNADHIVVLPNNSNVLLAAQSAAKEYSSIRSDVHVFVLPTTSMQAGYVALMVATDSEDVEPVLANMQDAIENAACLSLTYSVRDSSVNGMDIRKGDQIGFLGKELCACAATVEACLKQLLLQVEDLEDKEIATVMYGNDTTEEDRETLRSLIEELCPEAELVEYDCAQELYSLLITLE